MGDGPAARAFRDIANLIITETVPPVQMAGCSARVETVTAVAVNRRTA
jgi:hypothetical protein